MLLGLLPQELLGTSMYEYYHADDIVALTEVHKSALQATESVTTAVECPNVFLMIANLHLMSFRSIVSELKKAHSYDFKAAGNRLEIHGLRISNSSLLKTLT